VIASQLADAWFRTIMLHDHNTRVVVIATSLLGLAAGAIGSFTLLRRRALMGDALSHAMLPGIGLAFLIAPALGLDAKSLPVLLGGAGVSGLVGTLAILVIRHQTRLKEDAALGIVLSVFFGAGLAILGLVQQTSGGHAAGLESFIYGKTASITTQDAVWIATTAVFTLFALVILLKELTLLCFDEGYAAARGFSVIALDIALMVSVVLITVVGLQAVGLILMIALLVIPASSSRFWTNRIGTMLWLSAVIGACSCLIGAIISATIADLPSGATIVLVAAGIFFFSMLFGTERGMAIRRFHRYAMNRKTDRQHVLRGLYEIIEAYPASSSQGAGRLSNGNSSDDESLGAPVNVDSDAGVSFTKLLALRSWSPTRLKNELRRCAANGLITRQNDTIRLTAAGWKAANQATREHRLWELYLITHADVAPGRVDRDAERIEHVLEPEMIAELEELLPLPTHCLLVPDCPHSAAASSPITPSIINHRPGGMT